jgi:hypothetical protein
MLTPKQRHALLMADRTKDVAVIRGTIDRVLSEDPDTTFFDIEMAFRDAAAHTYLVMEGGSLRIVFGMSEWLEAMKLRNKSS